MKKHIALACLTVISSGALASTGIGVSAQIDDIWVYVPIDLTESFRIEPLVRYYKKEDQSDSEDYTEISEFGVGLFVQSEVVENFNFLYGVRVAYSASKYTYKSQFFDSGTDQDGYLIAPTIGFEYFLADKISLGGDVSLVYTDLDGKDTDSGESIDVSEKTTSTDTSLIVRFYF